jgi:hypothetical protein
VIKLFHSIVRFGATVSHIAFISLLWGDYMLAYLGGVSA